MGKMYNSQPTEDECVCSLYIIFNSASSREKEKLNYEMKYFFLCQNKKRKNYFFANFDKHNDC